MFKIYASKTIRGNAGPASDLNLLHRNLSTAVIAFHEAVARRSGMGISEHKCLGALSLIGAATAGRLARETGFTTGAITGIVDRLETLGHVRREPNPDDRRSVIIRPLHDAERMRRTKPLFEPLSRAMARLQREFSAGEIDAIYRYLQRTTDILKEEARRLQT
ncbi:MAG TPA: MarR family transcriptional regulator [Rhizomicrobium sp.]|nr:MarR family transcriptional regulator [Rhizomicrobium sp.]